MFDQKPEFGDDAGPDDMWDASGAKPDPEAVTIRFHDERVNRGDTKAGYWETLSPQDQDVARMIGYAVLEHILAGETPRQIGNFLDALREYLGVKDLRHRDSQREEHTIQAVIVALSNEGTLV
jgi:hypothetical protein